MSGGTYRWVRPIYDAETERIPDPKAPQDWRKGSEVVHVDNEDIMDVAEDIVAVLKDLDELLKNKELMRALRAKGMAALREPHMQTALKYLREDTNVRDFF